MPIALLAAVLLVAGTLGLLIALARRRSAPLAVSALILFGALLGGYTRQLALPPGAHHRRREPRRPRRRAKGAPGVRRPPAAARLRHRRCRPLGARVRHPAQPAARSPLPAAALRDPLGRAARGAPRGRSSRAPSCSTSRPTGSGSTITPVGFDERGEAALLRRRRRRGGRAPRPLQPEPARRRSRHRPAALRACERAWVRFDSVVVGQIAFPTDFTRLSSLSSPPFSLVAAPWRARLVVLEVWSNAQG